MKSSPPAGLAPEKFLRQHWHRKPLLLRQAFPGFAGLLSPRELMRLACRDDAQSRLVLRHGRSWELRHGPFRAADFRGLPERGWSLLVQEVNHFLPEAERLLACFDFVPRARLDDLMVSYAPDGGGVGPHFDSYDVFLLQGLGRRRWRISAQEDRELVPRAPLRILRRFRPQREWVLESGDMLYLPPRYAHEGIAVGECMTYSIGFRAPSHQELLTGFLDHLAESIHTPGMYEDPGLRRQREPARIGAPMLRQVQAVISGLRWRRGDILRFLGCQLTEPRPHVFFSPPRSPVTRSRFSARCRRRGVRLDPRTRLLYTRGIFFINGDALEVGDASAEALLRRLANERELPPGEPGAEAQALLYRWYRHGYIAG
ncbi:MAG TPA: cupin domain-containing protein [Burkholderiales bacterium]|nr:cupin domain-containing protein [Burkholderiales bacterium]